MEACRQWRYLRDLEPLWCGPTETVPQVVLQARIPRRRIQMRLHRRMTEIGDAALALREYACRTVTGQHVLLAVRDNDEALLVERLPAHDAVPVRFRVGERMALTTTGVGLVLLANAPVEVQERAVRDFTPGDGGDAIHTAEDLRRSLAEVRRGDYAVARRADPRSPRTTAAAPVRGREDVVAALSVVAPTPKFDSAAYVPAVRATDRAISRQLQSTEAAR
ncbi:DUF6545 domain-containing protein [Streptomyces sp. NBC_00932]|uniref:IclR family transcriptional regulator domain-containing protein n=1 Tax=Streptomyces sp. NBC_00932 TaxID=2903690 RepID=UPI0038637625